MDAAQQFYQSLHQEAEDKLLALAHQLDDLFKIGDDESLVRVLELKPSFDRAVIREKTTLELYRSREKTTPESGLPSGGKSQLKPLQRKVFDNLSLKEKVGFIHGGGSLFD